MNSSPPPNRTKYHIDSIPEISKNKEMSERSKQKVTKSNSLGNCYHLAWL